MPTYEYECRDCGRRFEKFQAMSDKPARKCPDCGGRARRLISAGGAVIVRAGRASAPCGLDAACRGRDSPCKTCPLVE